MKIYFFPGLGADASLAPYHLLPGHEIHWVEWPERFGSSWDEFIRELRKENDFAPGAAYAGISFGGLVALRLAREVKPDRIILIGSLSSYQAVSGLFRLLSPFIGIIPSACFRMQWVPDLLIRYFFGIGKEDDLALFHRMADPLPGWKAKRLVRMALSGGESKPAGVPILNIHGTDDRIIPIAKRSIDIEVPGGGHFISVTHSGQINEAISKWMG